MPLCPRYISGVDGGNQKNIKKENFTGSHLSCKCQISSIGIQIGQERLQITHPFVTERESFMESIRSCSTCINWITI